LLQLLSAYSARVSATRQREAWAIRACSQRMWLAACSPVWLEGLLTRAPPCAAPRAPPARMMGDFAYTGTTRPGKQTPRRMIPKEIPRPDYAADGKPKQRGPLFPWQIEVKTPKDIEGMRVAGRVAREVLDAAGRMVAPGVQTDAIDALVTEESIKRGAYPSPLNYHGFPKSCCTSVNEVICHGI
jgi:methionyl aminopeptidase